MPQKSENPSRLWWCPTGAFTFLPIHAAGKYDRQSQIPIDTVADYVISSYTPTLTALLSSPLPLFATNSPVRTTAIIQPTSPGYLHLPYTEEELRTIEKIIPKEWLTSLGTVESPATVETVLQHLQTSSIIHFACHGIQDKQKPLQSALLIDSDRLTMSQIMKTSGFAHDRPENPGKHLGLAFLSACQTASGDKKAPDEAMHLAATLLFAGFRSVVATMW
jgi:CHAT domain-containing protein